MNKKNKIFSLWVGERGAEASKWVEPYFFVCPFDIRVDILNFTKIESLLKEISPFSLGGGGRGELKLPYRVETNFSVYLAC